jgi:hypothetical protein
MEVEVSRKSLDCSGYWQVAMVADNSHVVHLDVEGRAPNCALVDVAYHFSCHSRRCSQKWQHAENPNEKRHEARWRAPEQVRVKGRSDDKIQIDLSQLVVEVRDHSLSGKQVSTKTRCLVIGGFRFPIFDWSVIN